MSNNITLTVELGPESQAKLDKILEALQGIQPNCSSCVESAVQMAKHMTIEEAATPAATTEEIVTEIVEPVEPIAVEPELPQYSKEDILILVQKLAAPTNPKREQAKAIVKGYASKVSDIPEDKYREVMEKLTALDREEG